MHGHVKYQTVFLTLCHHITENGEQEIVYGMQDLVYCSKKSKVIGQLILKMVYSCFLKAASLYVLVYKLDHYKIANFYESDLYLFELQFIHCYSYDECFQYTLIWTKHAPYRSERSGVYLYLVQHHISRPFSL